MIRTFLRFNPSFSIGILFLFLFNSCEVFDPKEQVPSYIHIDKIDLTTDYATQGSSSSKFTDAWIYIDDEPLGAYELPATVPVLKGGSHQVKVRGGIKVNGISATRAQYVMCNFFTQYADLQTNNTVNLSPSVSYFPAIYFRWKEDFESVGVSLTTSSASDTSLQLTSDPAFVFEGSRSGAVYLDASRSFFECTSSIPYSLPLGDVFIELNYKCNNTFSVGVYASGIGTPFTALYINPSTEWNKIYINLADQIGASQHASSYTVFINMTKEDAVDFPELFLDNIKLVHQ